MLRIRATVPDDLAAIDEIYHAYRREGTGPAMQTFSAVAGLGRPRLAR
jgi:hypothetical protein